MNETRLECGVRFQEGPNRLWRYVAAAREGDVGMERAEVGFETGSEQRFLDSFVELEQMRMAAADSDPEDFRPAFAGECSETDEREEEASPRNFSQFFRKRFLGFWRHVPEESEREMHLARLEPANTAQVRV